MTHNFTDLYTQGLKTRLFRSILVPLLSLGFILTLTGCHDDDDNLPATPQGSIRVLHTSPDAPPVNVKLDGVVAISDLDYAQSSGFVDVDAKDYTIAVEGIIPSGNADVITVPGFTVAEDDRTTIIAADVVASIAPLVVSDSAATPAGTEVALRVVHTSPTAAAAVASVDVYVTAPGISINSISPTFNFAFKEDIDAGALPAGVVQI
ncbi:MAG: DUF4397 domain-containing protein, partial [Halobacteria archaeon]|nr:DUF4397 domain-containing protein [Halobacteria archaeon]